MKTFLPGSFRKSPGARGFALVVVLGILVLVVILAVGFLLRASTERSAASSYQASSIARQMADIAVGLVQGQINMAATQGSDVAWVSQPGMVRTFDTSGDLLRAYKLYSATDMVASSVDVTNGKSDDAAPTDWASSPAFWTDLNSPVTDAGGVRNYPIVDPSLANGTAIPGYALDSPPGATPGQPAPMPVRWLYVLKEGQMVAPSSGSGRTAQAFHPVAPTADNPIVGRVAFWTDDETCKVNINTAGEGTFWDVPRVISPQELSLARFQPAQKEYQRYPGHPATTSLSAVLPGSTLENYLALTPRYKHGGSLGATAIPGGAINLSPAHRLLPSLDELIFQPDRTEADGMDRAGLEARRFLLTAHSRAPETNLFNLPRIATWPVHRLEGSPPWSLADLDSDRTTVFDRLIAFCASTGGIANGATAPPLLPYFFQRDSALSGTNDFAISRNREVYSYLQALTARPIPGFGNTFLAKYPQDRDQILTEIFDYIRCENLYDDNLVGNQGYQFTGTRGGNDVVTPGFGMVTPGRNPANNTQGFGRFYTVTEMGFVFICNAQPDNPATSAIDESSGSNNPATNPALGGTPLNANEKKVQGMFLFELFSPMQGFVPMGQNMKIEIAGLENFTVNGVNLGLPASSTWTLDSSYMSLYNGRQWGGNPDWRAGFFDSQARNAASRYPFVGFPLTISATANSGRMAFSGGAVTLRILSSDNQEVQNIRAFFPGANFPIPDLVTAGTSEVTGEASATAKEHWWKFNSNNIFSGTLNVGRLRSVGQRPSWDNPGTYYSGNLYRGEDVVRTISIDHGDFRMVAARASLDDSAGQVFKPHPSYAGTTKFAHNLARAPQQSGYTTGKYIDSITYDQALMPDVLANSPVNATSTGDFDTGVSMALDGPYINKPDEGNTRGLSDPTKYPYFHDNWLQVPSGPTFFSPNRQVASPVTFGSLPTGIFSNNPWQTLLFRPLATTEASHPGADAPHDHLLLDLFWMPVVEPYAISDRFSTAGKVNMNFQILPFTYITRQTGLYAVLKNEKFTSFPNTAASTDGTGWYKLKLITLTSNASYNNAHNPIRNDPQYRQPIDVAETLKSFTGRFSSGDVFRSASEICAIPVVPQGEHAADMADYWDRHRLTGDNVRENLYGRLYPRLTTKSNTYTVHFRAQSLRQVPGSDPSVWTEGRDRVTGEYRGSSAIERFIDANNPNIPDYAADPTSLPTLDAFYRWRTIENRQFAP